MKPLEQSKEALLNEALTSTLKEGAREAFEEGLKEPTGLKKAWCTASGIPPPRTIPATMIATFLKPPRNRTDDNLLEFKGIQKPPRGTQISAVILQTQKVCQGESMPPRATTQNLLE